MSVYKDGSKWRVIYRYTDSRGERKQTQKRGFSTKKEAQSRVQLCSQVLRTSEQSHSQGRQYGESEEPGDAVLDER